MQKVSELVSSSIGDTLTNVKTWKNVMYNVLEHGLVGDGVTNDTAALQTLINLAVSEGRKTVFFPHTPSGGKYFVTSLTNANQVEFIGDNCAFVGGYLGVITDLGAVAEVKTEVSELNTKVNNLAISITDFGAVGDGGKTDCTQAIINAISACPPGGKVLIPAASGYYKVLMGRIVIDKTISFEGLTSGDDQNGGDVDSCRLVFFPNGSAANAIEITASNVNLKNFTMYDTNPNSGHIGIRADSKINITMERIWIRAFDYPINFSNCIQCTFRQVNARDCVTGFTYSGNGTSMLLEQCWVQNATTYGYMFTDHAYSTLVNCLMDGNPSAPTAQPNSAIYLVRCNTINLVGCASERTKNSHLYFNGCEDITVSNYIGVSGNISVSFGHSFAFMSASGKNIVFINPRDYQPTAGTSASITKGYAGNPPIIIAGNLPFGYNDQGAIITVPTGAVLVGFGAITEDAYYLKASDTGTRKKLTVNNANTITVVNA